MNLINNTTIILSIISLAIILFFIIKRRNKKKQLRNQLLSEGEKDFKVTAENIAQGIAKGRKLYKKLIVKVHPDRFLDHRKIQAGEITSRLTAAELNYNELLKIEKEIETFLELNKE